MKKLLFILIPSMLFAANCFAQESSSTKRFAVADYPTPVFNTPDFPAIFGGSDGKTLSADKCQQIQELEFIALPKTVFKIGNKISKGKITIYKVTADDYPDPTDGGLFIDSRFVSTQENEPRARSRALLKKQTIVENLVSADGSIYTSGGNYNEGIQKMLSIYPPAEDAKMSPEVRDRWTLKGVDASGLLYEATNGYTPRNISSLVDLGRPVRIAGLNIKDIMKKVEPLDLIAWQGHVIIILDKERAIESRLDYDKKKAACNGKVRLRPLKDVLGEVMSTRTPADKYTGKNKFIIRRWYPESQF